MLCRWKSGFPKTVSDHRILNLRAYNNPAFQINQDNERLLSGMMDATHFLYRSYSFSRTIKIGGVHLHHKTEQYGGIP